MCVTRWPGPFHVLLGSRHRLTLPRLFPFLVSLVANEPLYCTCQNISYGNMICCDNDNVSPLVRLTGGSFRTPRSFLSRAPASLLSLCTPHQTHTAPFPVPNRVVPLRLRRADGGADGKVVLPLLPRLAPRCPSALHLFFLLTTGSRPLLAALPCYAVFTLQVKREKKCPCRCTTTVYARARPSVEVEVFTVLSRAALSWRRRHRTSQSCAGRRRTPPVAAGRRWTPQLTGRPGPLQPSRSSTCPAPSPAIKLN